MYCPHCNHQNTVVVNTRRTRKGLRRRRKCEDCNERFSTLEYYIDDAIIIANNNNLAILKKIKGIVNEL